MNALTQKALQIGLSPSGIANVRADAKKVLPSFPTSGCATFLSVLLRHAGFDLPPITWAENLADHLKDAGWQAISKRQGKAGDVGVSIDGNGNQAADHIWLTLSLIGDQMMVADNQSTQPHARTISGRDGRTLTDYFLRAPESPVSAKDAPPVTINGLRLEPGWSTRIDGELFIRARSVEEAGVGVVDFNDADGSTSIRVLQRP